MKGLWLGAAFIACVAGFGWLALAMETHWQQVRGRASLPGAGLRVALRAGGVLALAASLLLCLRADHASIAVLVWVMLLAAAALVVAFALSWRPAVLRPLLAGAGGRERTETAQ